MRPLEEYAKQAASIAAPIFVIQRWVHATSLRGSVPSESQLEECVLRLLQQAKTAYERDGEWHIMSSGRFSCGYGICDDRETVTVNLELADSWSDPE